MMNVDDEPSAHAPLLQEETTAENNQAQSGPLAYKLNLISYWILGLCNNYGYVVMLSAAHDILSETSKANDFSWEVRDSTNTTHRDCNEVSTGAILLADILPSLGIKLLAPFLPMFVHLRIGIAVILAVVGFLLVALAKTQWGAILGVVFTSLSSGLGEVTFLSYSSQFDKNVVSTWASGTGGAGVLGSFSYAGLTSLGLSSTTTILIMLVVPALMIFTFWGLLRHPQGLSLKTILSSNDHVELLKSEDDDAEAIPMTLQEKLAAIPPLFKYMIPLGAVYLFEYFINQGLLELIYFDNVKMSHAEQYRWLQVDYQVGVFISRSSVNLFQINKLWLLAVLQGINVIFFVTEVVLFFVPYLWIIILVVLWEGLLGGASYVNTFYLISHKVPADRRQFSLGVTTLSDAIGIAIAGFISIPAHNFFCDLPVPT